MIRSTREHLTDILVSVDSCIRRALLLSLLFALAVNAHAQQSIVNSPSILWQNDNGDVARWFMNGGTINSSVDFGVVANGWTIQGTGDFNGDGNADILWRNSNGDVVVWFTNGGTFSSSTDLGVIPNSWTIQGTGDFNGDGKTDILWRNANGDVAIWFMNGGIMNSSADLGVVPSNWTIQGTGDFNSDGLTDILWRNTTTGDVVIWFMNAGATVSSADLGVIPSSWTIQGTGVAGQPEILWRNSNGDVNIWVMNGGTIASSTDLGVVPTSWMIQGTGDFNSDGQTDILWRNSNGDVVIWFMNDGTFSSSADLGVIPPSWTIRQTQPPNGVPAPAKAVGYTANTFDSTTLGNAVGQLYFPTGFYNRTFGTATQNADGSFTMTNGVNLPMVATAHHDSSKPNKWGGECFGGGGYFDTYASWTPYAGLGQSSWPQVGLEDSVTLGNNAVGPWNQWGTQAITATAIPTTGATSIGIPTWAGVNNTTISGLSIIGTAGQFAATFSGLFVGETITISGSFGGSGSINGYSSPTTYYVSAVNAAAQTFTLQTMGQAALTTTAGSLTGVTYTPGLSGTVTFSDSETQLVSFTPGATSISWTNGLTGSSFTPALSVNWGSNFGNWPELPVVEADWNVTTSLGIGALINWYAPLGSNIKTQTTFTVITAIDTSTPHHYSVLWVPATASAQGYINWYLDGTVVNSATWNQYNSNTPPAFTGMETNNHLWTGGDAFGAIDSRCMIFNFSTATGTSAPMTIYSVNVWQAASSSSNQTQ